MHIRFVIERGGRGKPVFRMVGKNMIVGRHTGCGLRVPSAEVSRQHCRLTVEDGFLWVQDLESANGTYLNDARVVERELVRPGDRLQIGPVTFVVEYELDQEALDRLARMQPVPDPGQFDEFVMLNDDSAEEVVGLAVSESESDPVLAEMEEESVEVELDGQFDLPADEQLRDFLAQLQDGDGEPAA